MCVVVRKKRVDPLMDPMGLGYEVSCEVNAKVGSTLESDNTVSGATGLVRFGHNNCKRDIWWGTLPTGTFYVQILGSTEPPNLLDARSNKPAVRFKESQISISTLFSGSTTVYAWSLLDQSSGNFEPIGYADLDNNIWGLIDHEERQPVETDDVLKFEVYTIPNGASTPLYECEEEPQS